MLSDSMASNVSAYAENTPDFSLLRRLSTPEPDEETWARNGEQLQMMSEQLGSFERQLNWHIGDWWNRGERWGRRVQIVTSPNWRGPSLKTCRNLGSIAKQVDLSRRRDTLPFTHQAELVRLPPRAADEVMDQVEQEIRETGFVPPSRKLRHIARTFRRSEREQEMAIRTQNAGAKLGTKLYGVVLADPPWRYKTWADGTGMPHGAPPAHETIDTEDLCNLELPVARDAVLFLWRSTPMLADAMRVIEAWGFEFKSEIVWVKNKLTTGFWVRGKHETLMIATRGHPVAPAAGEQPPSVIQARIPAKLNHKPEIFHEIIEAMYPNTGKLELFARKFRRGWDAYGNEPPGTWAAD